MREWPYVLSNKSSLNQREIILLITLHPSSKNQSLKSHSEAKLKESSNIDTFSISFHYESTPTTQRERISWNFLETLQNIHKGIRLNILKVKCPKLFPIYFVIIFFIPKEDVSLLQEWKKKWWQSLDVTLGEAILKVARCHLSLPAIIVASIVIIY